MVASRRFQNGTAVQCADVWNVFFIPAGDGQIDYYFILEKTGMKL